VYCRDWVACRHASLGGSDGHDIFLLRCGEEKPLVGEASPTDHRKAANRILVDVEPS
jgi:hypothetical protein